MPLKDFNETFEDELRDPEFATHFVQEALDDSYETGDIGIFLVALRDVARANRAMARTARRANATRPSLYKTLSEEGKPQFETVFSLMPEMGFRFSVAPIEKRLQTPEEEYIRPPPPRIQLKSQESPHDISPADTAVLPWTVGMPTQRWTRCPLVGGRRQQSVLHPV